MIPAPRQLPRVLSLGVATPLGLGTKINQTEIAAGSMLVTETKILDPMGTPIRTARIPMIHADKKRAVRMAGLGRKAVRECLRVLDKRKSWDLPLFLGLPGARSGGLVDANALLERLRTAMPPTMRLNVSDTQIFATGRAAVFEALKVAVDWLDSGAGKLALVGGIDSMCDVASLTYLGKSGRALGAANPDGVIPGEAAAFILLGRDDILPSASSGMRVVACAIGQEARHFSQTQPNLAAGLTKVLRDLRSDKEVSRRRPDYLLSCQTGETFWAKEFTMAYLRNATIIPEPLRASLIAEWLGDVGAASGAVLVAIAEGWLRKQAELPDPPKRVLIYGCSDDGPIGACVVEVR